MYKFKPGLGFHHAEQLILELLIKSREKANIRGSLGIVLKRVQRVDFPKEIRESNDLALTEEGLLVFLENRKGYTPTRAYHQRLSYSGLADLDRDPISFQKNVAYHISENIIRLGCGHPLSTLNPHLINFFKSGVYS